MPTTIADIQEILRELAEAQQKTEQGFQVLQKEHQKTEQAHQKTEQAQQKTEQAQQKTERVLQELKEAVEKTSESIDKANGNFNNKWGEFVENFIEGDLLSIFKQRNIEVNRILPRATVRRSDNTIEAEYDFIIANGEEVIVIEVKTTVSSSKLDTFIDKLQLFKKRFPEYGDKKIYGGIAYIKANRELRENAERMGFFLIQAPGGENSVTSIMNPEDFVPKAY